MAGFDRWLETSATGFELIRDGEREWAVRIDMIERARAYVFLSTYYLERDQYADELLRKLVEAARRGVEVRLAYDSFAQNLAGASATRAQRGAQRRVVEELRDAGADITVWRSRGRRQRLLGTGNHIKVQLSEAGQVLFGSSNVSRRSICEWNELSALMSGPVTVLLEQWFLAAIGRPYTSPRHVEPVEGGQPFDFVWCHPGLEQSSLWPLTMAANSVTDVLVDAIDRARGQLWITSFYFKPTPVLRRAVLDAARRGVRVVVVHSHRDALFESRAPWFGAAAVYDEILDAGVRIYELEPGEHSKVVVVDETWAAFGTYNFEHAAHDRLAEAMLITRETGLVDDLRRSIQEAAFGPGAQMVTRQTLRNMPLDIRAKTLASRVVQRWL